MRIRSAGIMGGSILNEKLLNFIGEIALTLVLLCNCLPPVFSQVREGYYYAYSEGREIQGPARSRYDKALIDAYELFAQYPDSVFRVYQPPTRIDDQLLPTVEVNIDSVEVTDKGKFVTGYPNWFIMDSLGLLEVSEYFYPVDTCQSWFTLRQEYLMLDGVKQTLGYSNLKPPPHVLRVTVDEIGTDYAKFIFEMSSDEYDEAHFLIRKKTDANYTVYPIEGLELVTQDPLESQTEYICTIRTWQYNTQYEVKPILFKTK